MTTVQPALMEFGAVHLVAPNGWPRLTQRQWADIEVAMILTANDKPGAAAAVILDFEERIGTRPAHRRAAHSSVEAVNREIARVNRHRVKAERDRVRNLQAPWKPPPYDAKPLAKALRKLGSGDKRQAKEAVADLVAIEEAHRIKAEAMRVTAEQAEIRNLAEARGDDLVVESNKARGYVDRSRITNRDGLEHLLACGSITKREFQAGHRYRELYEKTDPERSLKPVSPGAIHSPHHGGEDFAKKFGEWVHQKLNIEREVIEIGQHRYALLALQEVAGSKRMVVDHLRVVGKDGSGHARARYVSGLRVALRIAAEQFGIRE